MNFDLEKTGFAFQPVLTNATGAEKLYRAWGGDPQRKWGNKDLPGVCFSMDRAASRWQAEMLYSIAEHRNPLRYLTEFSVPKGTPLWLGKVDPGDPRALLGSNSGSQVLVERIYMVLVKEVSTQALRNDLGSHEIHAGHLPSLSS